ncbi:adenylate/guanylate cyclase domain-containing protein [Paraglaciecola sp. L3A3]|uniref:adenylate/guanylate cyclase domain-containing protein n=1 Tax=Paraglaciecola sp. L3A3 TaxID=2686358 RepID=UPI00131BFA6E|nr:adenylate/guanylate cyclase domain-containing protein [Paraglaciecola sp. L3A3]
MLKNLLKLWVSAGIARYPHEYFTPVRLTNIIAFLVILVSVCQIPNAIWFWQQAGKYQLGITCSTITLLILVPTLNHFGYYLTAKIWLNIIYILNLIVTCLLWQLDLYIHFFYLLAVVCCPFFFTEDEVKYKWFFSLLFSTCFLATEIYYQLNLVNPYTPAQQNFKFASACLLTLASLLCSFHIQKNISRSWKKLAFEKMRSEQLLLNILPNSIAQRLKNSTHLIADYFAQASILFADIQDFTPICKKHSPQQLVKILNEIFCTFDELSLKYGLEKIKTSGDGYMAAGGLPKADSKHAIQCCCCAIEMQQAFQKISKKHNLKTGLRIGIGCGEVVAGIIGKNKFSYDMWGEAVNLASRMESHGLCNKIQTTQSTYDLTKNTFDYVKRGEIKIKGLGLVNTYWLLGRKQKLG